MYNSIQWIVWIGHYFKRSMYLSSWSMKLIAGCPPDLFPCVLVPKSYLAIDLKIVNLIL